MYKNVRSYPGFKTQKKLVIVYKIKKGEALFLNLGYQFTLNGSI